MSKLDDKLVGPNVKPELSPNPDGSGYVQQLEVDSLSDVVSPKENVLYIVGDRKYKYLSKAVIHPGTNEVIVPAGWVRVENGPQSHKVNRGQETPHNEVTTPKERPQVFNIPVSFLKDIFVKGKKLEDYIDSEGGVTEDEMHAYVPQAIQADKDILSQIEVEEEDGNTLIFFPSHILPISWYDANPDIDDNVFVNYDGIELLNSLGERINSEVAPDSGTTQIYIVLFGVTNYSKDEMYDLLYMHLANIDDIGIYKNWYSILNPKPSGTKLYRHVITATEENYVDGEVTIIVISPQSSPYTDLADVIPEEIGVCPPFFSEGISGFFIDQGNAIYLDFDNMVVALKDDMSFQSTGMTDVVSVFE